MKNLQNSFYILVLGLFLLSCSSSSEPEIVPPGGGGTTAKTTYDKDVKTIINNSCATSACHDSTNPPNGLSLTNYAEVKAAAQNGALHTRIDNGTMPPNQPLAPSQKSIIDKWKADGYLEN